jgi:hypothetical protein
MSEEMSTLRRGPSPRLGERRLRRLAELALIVAAIFWRPLRRLPAAGWLGAGLIRAVIVAVEVAPRLRPPRPLPEG